MSDDALDDYKECVRIARKVSADTLIMLVRHRHQLGQTMRRAVVAEIDRRTKATYEREG